MAESVRDECVATVLEKNRLLLTDVGRIVSKSGERGYGWPPYLYRYPTGMYLVQTFHAYRLGSR